MKPVMGNSGKWWGAISLVTLAAATLACAMTGVGLERESGDEVPLDAISDSTEAPVQPTEEVVVGPASPVDACTVLKQADAEVIFSGASQPGVPDETANLTYSCTYTNQAGDRQVELIVWTFSTSDEANGQLGDTISSSMNIQVVNGIGDAAYFDTSGYARIFFTKGSYYVALIVNPGDENFRAILTATAQTVLVRLP